MFYNYRRAGIVKSVALDVRLFGGWGPPLGNR
jgi:hypothetical protein